MSSPGNTTFLTVGHGLNHESAVRGAPWQPVLLRLWMP